MTIPQRLDNDHWDRRDGDASAQPETLCASASREMASAVGPSTTEGRIAKPCLPCVIQLSDIHFGAGVRPETLDRTIIR
jgi:hypothetical protein